MNTTHKKKWLEKHGAVIFYNLSNYSTEITGEWTSHGGAKMAWAGSNETTIRNKLYELVKENMYQECIYHETP